LNNIQRKIKIVLGEVDTKSLSYVLVSYKWMIMAW